MLQRRRNVGDGSARAPPPHLYEQHERQIRQQHGSGVHDGLSSTSPNGPSSKGPGPDGGVLTTNGVADIDYKHVFLKGSFVSLWPPGCGPRVVAHASMGPRGGVCLWEPKERKEGASTLPSTSPYPTFVHTFHAASLSCR